MTREAERHYASIYQAIQLIPEGKVTTYGYIAKLIGFPRNARQVGYALKQLPSEQARVPAGEIDEQVHPQTGLVRQQPLRAPHYHSGNVPWWRVIGSGGSISVRENSDGRDRQVHRLLQEGIQTVGDTYKVSMKMYGWDLTSSEEDRIMDRLINGSDLPDGPESSDSE